MKVRANGIQIHYELEGPVDAPVVTLSHSLGANLSMWNAQVPALSTRYRLLRYDTRGHGGSEATAGAYTFELLAQDVRELLRALEIDRTHFIGLSMGGMVGQALGFNHPEVLHSLVLCDTTSGWARGTEKMRQDRIRIVEERGIEPLIEGTVQRWFTQGFVEAHPETVESIRQMLRTTSRAGYLGVSHALNALNYTDRLGEIRVPTLIIVGDQDEGTPVTASEAMHERIPGSKLVVLETAKHLSNIEQAEAFSAAVLEFLRSV